MSFGTDVPMRSTEDEEKLLRMRAEADAARDEAARAFQIEQENARVAREDSQRLLAQQEEKQRMAVLEEQEREGADVAMDMMDDTDTDTGVANMFASLAFGTAEEGEGVTDEDARPE
tara:strand:- start:68 stop:418 length:351 start_codon:yes stop_codon:yes gene_type:complete